MEQFIGYIAVALLGIVLAVFFKVYIVVRNKALYDMFAREKERAKIIKRASQHIIEREYFQKECKLEEYPLLSRYITQSDVLVKYYTSFSAEQKKKLSVVPIYREPTSDYNNEKFWNEIMSADGTIRNLFNEVSDTITLFYKTEFPVQYRINENKKKVMLQKLKICIKLLTALSNFLQFLLSFMQSKPNIEQFKSKIEQFPKEKLKQGTLGLQT